MARKKTEIKESTSYRQRYPKKLLEELRLYAQAHRHRLTDYIILELEEVISRRRRGEFPEWYKIMPVVPPQHSIQKPITPPPAIKHPQPPADALREVVESEEGWEGLPANTFKGSKVKL